MLDSQKKSAPSPLPAPYTRDQPGKQTEHEEIAIGGCWVTPPNWIFGAFFFGPKCPGYNNENKKSDWNHYKVDPYQL